MRYAVFGIWRDLKQHRTTLYRCRGFRWINWNYTCGQVCVCVCSFRMHFNVWIVWMFSIRPFAYSMLSFSVLCSLVSMATKRRQRAQSSRVCWGSSAAYTQAIVLQSQPPRDAWQNGRHIDPGGALFHPPPQMNVCIVMFWNGLQWVDDVWSTDGTRSRDLSVIRLTKPTN